MKYKLDQLLQAHKKLWIPKMSGTPPQKIVLSWWPNKVRVLRNKPITSESPLIEKLATFFWINEESNTYKIIIIFFYIKNNLDQEKKYYLLGIIIFENK